MIILLSPSKTLDTETPWQVPLMTRPRCLEESALLVESLKAMSEKKLATLMEISPKLASLNAARYHHWKMPFTSKNATPAIKIFQGDVYTGLDACRYDDSLLATAQTHLRILSGLYGLLRPLDLIQPYRLEMGISLKNICGRDLYDFWGDKITDLLNADAKASKSKAIVNLASQEYFKVVRSAKLSLPVITPHFKERKNGDLKVVALFAKKARGRMADYLLRHGAVDLKRIKMFDHDRYRYQPSLSNETDYVFVR